MYDPNFNKEIEVRLLEKYSNVIFSNYELNNKLFECYEKNHFNKFEHKSSIFNQQVNLTHLTFCGYFNQEINLPPNLTHLTFGYNFNQQVNLPFSVQFLELECNNVKIINYLPDSIEELVLKN